jgi:hypothetical protein
VTAPTEQPPADKVNPPADGKGGRAPARPPVDLLSVVAFDRYDPVTGTDRTVVGVVVQADDQALTVRPLANHEFRVSRDEVSVVAAEDDEV